ncbi:hypothetical protein BASA81_003213 [Batrachochytrium salamandrivorans]|nr:hypothetical protein BASA81_003213 [Batrachochytrium salamandrivorans]
MEALVVLVWGVGLGLCAVAVYGLFIRPLRCESHSFSPTRLRRRREDRPKDAASEKYFVNKDKLYIYHEEWTNAAKAEEVKQVLVLVHGFGEHSGRYAKMANELLGEIPHLAVVALDHQGHGRSEGDRLYVRELEDFVEDVVQLSNLAKARFPQASPKQTLLGHSLGGLIAIRTLQRHPEQFAQAVISAPALDIHLSRMERVLCPLLSSWLPKLVTQSSVDWDNLCHDANVVDLYANDPLCVTKQGSTARLGGEMLWGMEKALAFAGEITVPYLLLRGKQDSIALRPGMETFHLNTSSADKSFVELDSLFHEIFNEPNGNVTAMAADWIKQRVHQA